MVRNGRWFHLAGYLLFLPLFMACGLVATPTPTPVEPKRFPLPYSYEEAGLRITVLEVVPAMKKVDISLPQGYRRWAVKLLFENLLNTDWEPRTLLPKDCAGLTSLKLKTDKSNIYKGSGTGYGGSNFCSSLKPKATYSATEAYIFEIREDERPIELWGYDIVGSSWQEELIYIFELAP